MIVFFSGRPIRFQKKRTSLTAVSLASEPELVKNTRSKPGGASSASRAASSIAAGVEHWKKVL